ncbi:MAG: recombination protein RecR [Deltaproteobacteria bacterium]|nr:MAG: recombination protein RecR [Deltaproteobacteria bacterium]
MLARPIQNLIRELRKLPGVGEKTATRLAMHVLTAPTERAEALARALTEVKERIIPCGECHQLTEDSPCSVCASARRDRTILCVVEDQVSLISIENSGNFNGLYHVLGGRLSPMDGVGPSSLNIADIKDRVRNLGVREVILATNPNVDGEATALYIKRLLEGTGAAVTRIARGVPMGGDLEYADSLTLGRAIEGRGTF